MNRKFNGIKGLPNHPHARASFLPSVLTTKTNRPRQELRRPEVPLDRGLAVRTTRTGSLAVSLVHAGNLICQGNSFLFPFRYIPKISLNILCITRPQNFFQPSPKQTPCLTFFVQVVMMKIAAARLASFHDVVLTTINDIKRNFQCLHHRRTSPAHVMRNPLPVFSGIQHQAVVIAPVSEKPCSRLKLTLSITDLFGDGLDANMAI